MEKAFKAIAVLNKWVGKIAAYLLYPGMIVLVYEVVARYLFNAPTIWAHGVSQRIFAVYFVLGAPYVLLKNGHIRMDMFYSRFTPRVRAMIDLATSPMLFATIFVLVYFGWDFAWTSIKVFENDSTPLHAPLWIIKVWIPITGVLLLLQALSNFCQDLITAITKIQGDKI